MTDFLFDNRLERAARAYGNEAIRPIEAVAMAEAAIHASRRDNETRRFGWHFPRAWAAAAATAVAIAVVVGGSLLLSMFGSNNIGQPSPPASLSPTPAISRSPSPAGSVEEFPVNPLVLRKTLPLVLGPRRGSAAILLADGRALIVGGVDPTAEIFDPVTGRFTTTGAMAEPRRGPMVALLDDGRVLVVGGMQMDRIGVTDGVTDGVALATAEIYDPTTGVFSSTSAMGFARATCCDSAPFADVERPGAIKLLDGRVLVVGGRQQAPGSALQPDAVPAQAELYDPSSGTFSQVVVGCDAARGAQARLADGRVLVTCLEGTTGTATNRARMFKPATDSFYETGGPTTTTSGEATLINDGRVLLTGAGRTDATSTPELYDPAEGTFTGLQAYRAPRPNEPVVTLGDGTLVFIEGSSQHPFFFKPSTGVLGWFGPAVSFRDVPNEPAAVLLRDGWVLIVGDAPAGALFHPLTD